MLLARGEIGTRERPGAADNERVLEYLAQTRLPPSQLHDETPWCAAFVTWCLEKSGKASTRSAGARSYLHWGSELVTPVPGCVVVLERHSPDNPHAGHVGFYAGSSGEYLMVLGGNQGNRVSLQLYPRSRVVGYRWPAA
jgi:uncharacterized protein (TIGR02594 family)